MPKEKIDEAIAKLNRELKLIRCRLRVERRHDRLVLRGTLPPKADSAKTKPYSQRLSIGTNYATPAGLRAAKKKALQVSELLDEGRFSWGQWLDEGDRSVADWVKAFKEDYFNRRGNGPKVQTTWKTDYHQPFSKLPQDAPLSPQLVLTAVAQTQPNTRARERYCTAYSALCKFAQVEVELKPLKGKYSPAAVNPRNLPNDDLIAEWGAKIPNEEWQTVYWLIAIYGLRNHECWYCDLANLESDAIARLIEVNGETGKTGTRLALPVPKRWWELWLKGRDLAVPKLTARVNRDYGRLSAQYFKRLGLPFGLYDLRHAHAARMAVSGIDGMVAAKTQGHSSKVHERIYLNFMDEEHYRKLLDNMPD
jgi:integrase